MIKAKLWTIALLAVLLRSGSVWAAQPETVAEILNDSAVTGGLIVAINKRRQESGNKSGVSPAPVRKWVAAIDTTSGKTRWKTGDYVGLLPAGKSDAVDASASPRLKKGPAYDKSVSGGQSPSSESCSARQSRRESPSTCGPRRDCSTTVGSTARAGFWGASLTRNTWSSTTKASAACGQGRRSAAHGRIYISARGGTLICYAGKQ